METITPTSSGKLSPSPQYREYTQSTTQLSSFAELPNQSKIRESEWIETFDFPSITNGHYPSWASKKDRYQWQEALIEKLVRVKYMRLDQTQHPLLSYLRQLARAEKLETWYLKRELRKAQESRKEQRNRR